MSTEKTMTVKLDSVDAYNRLYGLPTEHPLVSVISLHDAEPPAARIRMNYGIYALFLKNGPGCTLHYGRKSYDCQAGTIVSFAPGQTVDVSSSTADALHSAEGILFHHDLIAGTPLGEALESFAFFDYSQNEALHLDDDERAIITGCLDAIAREIRRPADRHTRPVICAGLQLLLQHIDRFYDRQFATRHKANTAIVAKLERLVRGYYGSGACREALPAVADFASELCLTPKYLSELVKRETGMTTKALIGRQLVSTAKQRLAASDDDVATIAYSLGFQHPAHFSRMFRRATGQSPTEFRRQTAV